MTIQRTVIIFVLWGLALLGGKFGCRAISHHERHQRLIGIEHQLDQASVELAPAMHHDLLERLNQALAQLEDRKLSPIALDTLRQRAEGALADGRLMPREASHLIVLLADFPHWQDDVHGRKYMGQR